MRPDERFEKKQRDFTINQAVDRGSNTLGPALEDWKLGSNLGMPGPAPFP